jgi:hypothetical protein
VLKTLTLYQKQNKKNERIKMTKFKGLEFYQKEYDFMKSLADEIIAKDRELTQEFYNELLALTKLVKSLGGKL